MNKTLKTILIIFAILVLAGLVKMGFMHYKMMNGGMMNHENMNMMKHGKMGNSCTENGESCPMHKEKSSHNMMGGMKGKGMNMMDHGKMGGMMGGKNKGEKFSESTENLPEVEPTKLIKLKDGDTFEMTAEMVKQEVGNRIIKRLAYNRQIPGPVIEVEKDAKIKIKLTNKLDVNTTLHSHGLRLDDDSFDGVPETMGGKQAEMKPGESFTYELNFPDTGVFWYHPHVREDYTQEMGLYGNYHVTEENYWNNVDKEEFLVLDDFSENDPFYKDFSNKTMMGRFGNILLINNQENFKSQVLAGEKVRFYITNTANTRTFDFSIIKNGIIQKLKIVGGDIGRGEKEFIAENFIIAPAERIIFETEFSETGTYEILHRGKKIGEIQSLENAQYIYGKNTEKNPNILRENLEDYKVIRDNLDKFLDQKPDKNLRLTIDMKGMGEMRMGEEHKDGKGNMMGGNMEDMMKKEKSLGGEMHMEDEGGIEWEDGMAMMNKMSNNNMMEWIILDETDPKNLKKNMEMSDSWKFNQGDFVKIKIFNDPKSMHPMQHPIHFHGQRFVVLTRDGKTNQNFQWKDTTLIPTGQTVELLVEMSNAGKWMTHCHIAEHMHAGMMFNFEVLEK